MIFTSALSQHVLAILRVMSAALVVNYPQWLTLNMREACSQSIRCLADTHPHLAFHFASLFCLH